MEPKCVYGSCVDPFNCAEALTCVHDDTPTATGRELLTEEQREQVDAIMSSSRRPFTGASDTMPSDSSARKNIPIATGLLDYFPAALAEVAKVSKYGNDKHNPGQPLHHARGKSTDHADALLRHLVDRGRIDQDTGMRHSAEVAWRALALLQQELEDAGLAPLPRGAKNPVENPSGGR